MQELADQSALPAALSIVAAILLVLGNAGFVAAEFALVSVRPGRLEERARQGSRRARIALHLVRHLDETLSACQVGMTLTSLALGWLGVPAFGALLARLIGPAEPWLGPAAVALSLTAAFLLVGFLHAVLGEYVPKRSALVRPERLSLALAAPLRAFAWLAWPLVVLSRGAARLVLRSLPVRTGEAAAHSLEEIRQLLGRSVRQGAIGLQDVRLLENLFRFASTQVHDVMVPRDRVVALDLQRPLGEMIEVARREEYSRYPLIEGSLEHVAGVLHVKDLLLALGEDERPDVRALVRRPLMIPESMFLETLLRRFQLERGHLAIVLDEYGGVAGIVTLEDVLEELVGELRDEFDAEERDEVRLRAGGGWVLDPVTSLDRARELVEAPPEVPEEVHTVAGLLQSALGRLPRAGDRIDFGAGHELVAAVVQGTRIVRVELVPVRSRPSALDASD
jgi:CBS domain containing-hemolysin-like protein